MSISRVRQHGQQLDNATLKHLQRLCAPQLQLRRRLLPPEDTPATIIRRLGAFLGNGLFQIGAGIEGVFDHLREGMQAFEAVRTVWIAEFGLAERGAQHRNGPIVNSCRHREGPAVLAAMRERKPRGIAEPAGGAVDDLRGYPETQIVKKVDLIDS
jgi:hypothetical protein